MMPAGRGLRHGRRPPAGRHQTGCGRIPTVANASAGMAEAPASCRRAGDRWSNTRGRARSDDGKSRADRIFQLNNGEVIQANQSRKSPGRFSGRAPASRGLIDVAPSAISLGMMENARGVRIAHVQDQALRAFRQSRGNRGSRAVRGRGARGEGPGRRRPRRRCHQAAHRQAGTGPVRRVPRDRGVAPG